MSQRMCISEQPFEIIKRAMGAAYFLLKGKQKVYLLAYPSADGKAEFLYAATPILGECFLCIWKYFHGAVTDVDKVD